jgi:hypothetical protein
VLGDSWRLRIPGAGEARPEADALDDFLDPHEDPVALVRSSQRSALVFIVQCGADLRPVLAISYRSAEEVQDDVAG